MAIPTASVKIELIKILGIPAAVLAAGVTQYARATIQVTGNPIQKSGRSRPIPAAGGDFDLRTEKAPWVFEVTAAPGNDIKITIDILQDRGNAAPPAPTRISGVIADPWSDGTRQIGGSGPKLNVTVTTKLVNPVDAAFLARASSAKGISGKLVVPQGFVVEIVDINGLYKPVSPVVPPAKGSKHVAGYISDDNLGRIFVNRKPNDTWAKDEQFIDVKLKITGLGGRNIPAGAKIKWTILDIDDPTNDEKEFHREWGRYVDVNDYDGAGTPVGANPKDNPPAFSPANADESKLFGAAVSGSATARWEKASGGPSVSPKSRTEAETDINGTGTTSGTSSVRIHCMNVLGTNLVVKAELINVPAGLPIHNATTGIMTMWSRIDIEVVRMAGAHSISGTLTSIPDFFVPACVQMDFQTERDVTGALNKAEMAADENLLSGATRSWVNNAGVFTNRGKGGWFFLGAARLPNPLPSGGSPPALFSGTTYTLGTTGTSAWVEVAGSLTNPDFVQFEWTDGAGDTHTASFSVDSSSISGGKTKIFLLGNDVTPEFTGHDADGSISHAHKSEINFFPRHQLNAGAGALLSGGFGVPAAGAKVEIFPPGATFVTGISPSVPRATPPGAGTGSFFAGRTVLFTHTPKFSSGTPPVPVGNFNSKVLSTVVHEFLHAFGMPHKCGQWNWRTPRVKSCCMNYFNTWLIDASKNLIPKTVRKQGDDMCGRHLMEVRRVHLDKNPGLNW